MISLIYFDLHLIKTCICWICSNLAFVFRWEKVHLAHICVKWICSSHSYILTSLQLILRCCEACWSQGRRYINIFPLSVTAAGLLVTSVNHLLVAIYVFTKAHEVEKTLNILKIIYVLFKYYFKRVGILLPFVWNSLQNSVNWGCNCCKLQ